jgi:ATP-dependent protease HslVU (ClpYQ) peptidase subunit
MTTILADLRKGLMVSDSAAGDGDRVWTVRKVWKLNGLLIGMAGSVAEHPDFLQWVRTGCSGRAPRFKSSAALVMSADELLYFSGGCEPMQVPSGIEAIGSGGKAAMCVYDALGFEDPAQVVRIVCKHDAGSRGPVKTYKL